jgi:hypothetical protein
VLTELREVNTHRTCDILIPLLDVARAEDERARKTAVAMVKKSILAGGMAIVMR